jgi:hypothetical protein
VDLGVILSIVSNMYIDAAVVVGLLKKKFSEKDFLTPTRNEHKLANVLIKIIEQNVSCDEFEIEENEFLEFENESADED